MSVHPRLLEAEKEIASAQNVVRTLQGRRDHKPYELDYGTWKCPDDMLEAGAQPEPGPVSPTGRCVYLPKDDPMRDNCLFCHGPDERK